jgi:dolichol-phosphate mannosyltransferase
MDASARSAAAASLPLSPERSNVVPAAALRGSEATAPAVLLSLVIPTRNEAANVEPLLQRLDSALAGIEYELLFVDDSDDVTPDLLRAHAGHNRRITVHHRRGAERKGGLSGAIVEGLSLARGEYVGVIDADLQHPPELLTQLLARAQGRGSDVVVASRYVPGGSAAGLRSGLRQLVSQGTRWLSRLLFHERLWSVQDPGSGFFIIRRQFLEGVALRPIGYKILLEMLVRTSWRSLDEVPYVFADRAGGASKSDLRQGLLFLQHLVRLFREVRSAGRLWKFLLVGASGTAVNLSILWLLAVQLEINGLVAWLAALEISVLSNFTLNRALTWNDRRAPGLRGLARNGLGYHFAVGAGMLISTVGFSVFSTAGLPVMVSGLAGIVMGAGANYLGCDRLVFMASRRIVLGTAAEHSATQSPKA